VFFFFFAKFPIYFSFGCLALAWATCPVSLAKERSQCLHLKAPVDIFCFLGGLAVPSGVVVVSERPLFTPLGVLSSGVGSAVAVVDCSFATGAGVVFSFTSAAGVVFSFDSGAGVVVDGAVPADFLFFFFFFFSADESGVEAGGVVVDGVVVGRVVVVGVEAGRVVAGRVEAGGAEVLIAV